jgi:hypothetical protein
VLLLGEGAQVGGDRNIWMDKRYGRETRKCIIEEFRGKYL